MCGCADYHMVNIIYLSYRPMLTEIMSCVLLEGYSTHGVVSYRTSIINVADKGRNWPFLYSLVIGKLASSPMEATFLMLGDKYLFSVMPGI